MPSALATLTPSPGSQQHLLVEVSKRKRSSKERRLLLIIVILIILILALFIAVCGLAGKIKKRNPIHRICKSKECINSADSILVGLNRTINPCKDFYAFTCGKWTNEHTSSSWFVERSTLMQSQLAGILLSEKTHNYNSSSVSNAKNLMHSCMDMDRREELGLKPMLDFLENANLPRSIPSEKTAAENWNLSETLAKAQRLASMDIIIQLSVVHVKNALNMTKAYLQFSPPREFNSPLPRLIDDPNHPKFSVIKDKKKLILAKVQFISGLFLQVNDLITDPEYTLNTTEIASASLKIMVIDSLLSKMVKKTPYTGVVQLTIEEFQKIMDEEDLDKSPNRFDVKKYVETLLGPELSLLYDWNENLIIIQNIEYFKKLRNLLATQHPESIQRYVWWEMAEPLIPHLNNDVKELRTKFYQQFFEDYKAPSKLMDCINAVKTFYPMAISLMMANKHPINKIKHKVKEMFEDIRSTFKDLVIASTWMDPPTKLKTFAKANVMRSFIGYPQWINDSFHVDQKYPAMEMKKDEYVWNMLQFRAVEVFGYMEKLIEKNETNIKETHENDEWEGVDPVDVNAFYKHSVNAIFIPAGILQRPFYGRGLESLNYGSIGTILGHEFTHGFDSFGRHFDEYGKRSSWWNETIEENFNEKANCFIKQYSSFELDGNYTLAENIADNGGLREAYWAFQRYKTKHPEHGQLLPGLEEFNSDQLFFLSYANMWCGKKKEMNKDVSLLDSHSPAMYRILGSLANSPEFADAWKCPSETEMNPKEKCILW